MLGEVCCKEEKKKKRREECRCVGREERKSTLDNDREEMKELYEERKNMQKGREDLP